MNTPRFRPARARRQRRGAIMILVAVLMPVFAIMAAFAIDVAWMQLVRTELRTATDAAARAGAKTLSLEQSVPLARAAAREAADRNLVAGDPLVVRDQDVQFGLSVQDPNSGRFTFTADAEPYNAVHVNGLRNAGSGSGPVGLFFGGVLGVQTFEPTHSATSTMLDRDVCLVIDRSGSMGLDLNSAGGGNGQNCGPLGQNTRFYALTLAIDDFLAELRSTYPVELVALATYSSRFQKSCAGGELDFETADIRQVLTGEYESIESVMSAFMQNGIGGNTAIGAGLQQGVDAVTGAGARPYAVKTIVLMTDGLHNHGVDPSTIAVDAAAQDITVHTVTFSPGADQARMQNVAETTGGQHFHADTSEDLRAAFREIARTLPVMITD